jgi:hypothetical protein
MMILSHSKKFLLVREGDEAPVIHVFVDGEEVAVLELTHHEALRLVSNLCDKIIESV